MRRVDRARVEERATNDWARSLEAAVTRRRVEPGRGALTQLPGSRLLELPELDDGFVALVHQGLVLGKDRVREGAVRSEISRFRAGGLKRLLDEDER